jgi:signal peptidase I
MAASEHKTVSPGASRVRRWAKTIFDLACIVLAVMAAKTAIAEPFYVPSGSMEPTLLIGDELLATKYPYGYSTASLPAFIDLPGSKRIFAAAPKRGDVVVFRWPGDTAQVWVKRVIGLPGDRIALRDGVVWIDGQPATQTPDSTGRVESEDGSTTTARRFIETLPGGRKHLIFKLVASEPLDNMPEVTVPPGHLFVMGDNRDNSADSRVPVAAGGVGLLPEANLVGRVDAIIGSWDLGLENKPIWTWPAGLRLSRFFSAVH